MLIHCILCSLHRGKWPENTVDNSTYLFQYKDLCTVESEDTHVPSSELFRLTVNSTRQQYQ